MPSSCLGLYLIINYTIILEDKDYIKASLSLFFIGKYKDCHFTISLEDNNYNLGK